MKHLKYIFVLIVAILFAIVIGSCGRNHPTGNPEKDAISLNLSIAKAANNENISSISDELDEYREYYSNQTFPTQLIFVKTLMTCYEKGYTVPSDCEDLYENFEEVLEQQDFNEKWRKYYNWGVDSSLDALLQFIVYIGQEAEAHHNIDFKRSELTK